ncbi:pentapeptide repeat-containing protein [Bremerella cremea]|uniref:pentapeptide repeat-containing protein n=1 Tax=Bremerella cremea TaxID=1031537 RepID=UPI0031ED1924
MNKSQSSVIVAESASASKTAYNEGKLTPAVLADLKAKHPNFTGDWMHLVQLEQSLRRPGSDPQRFSDWNLWRHEALEGDQPQDKVVHLEGISLRSADLRGVHLEGAVLRDATVAASDFRGARLAGAILTEANLSFCDFAEADLTASDLQDCNLDHANFRRANLAKADLTGAILTSAKLKLVQGAEANFGRGKLVAADLTGANLARASFERANLADVTLDSACLDGASLNDADLNYANLQNASLKQAELQRANLHGASAHGANCEKADFTAAILRQANLGNCDLRGAIGLLLDETFVTGGEFDAKANDPWTRLLQTYTWRNLVLVSLFFGLLAIPFTVGGYFKSAKELIERPIPRQVEEISANFFKVAHTDYEIEEFLRFRYDEFYAPQVNNLASRWTHIYLALGGIDGMIFWCTFTTMTLCLLQRLALTRSIQRLQSQNAIFRRTPKLNEYMGPYGPIGEEPHSWYFAFAKWMQGHVVEEQIDHGQPQQTMRPLRWAGFPGWWLAAMRSIKPLWKATPENLKRSPPPSWIDALGMTRIDRMNQSLTWGIAVIILFLICRLVIEMVLGSELHFGQ